MSILCGSYNIKELIGGKVKVTMLVETNIFEGRYSGNFTLSGLIEGTGSVILLSDETQKTFIVPLKYIAIEILKLPSSNTVASVDKQSVYADLKEIALKRRKEKEESVNTPPYTDVSGVAGTHFEQWFYGG